MDRQTYLGLLESLCESKKVVRVRLTRTRQNEIIAKVEAGKNQTGSKEPEVYRMARKYSIVQNEVDGTKRLAKRNTNPPRYYVCEEELYDVVRDAHLSCKHRGEKKTMAVIAKQYANVTWQQVRAYVTHCETCVAKKAHHTFKANSVGKSRSIKIRHEADDLQEDVDEESDQEDSTSMYPYLVETGTSTGGREQVKDSDDPTRTSTAAAAAAAPPIPADVDVIGADTERERLDVEKEKLAIIKEMWAQKKRLLDVTIEVMNLKRQKLQLEVQQLMISAPFCPSNISQQQQH